MSRHFELMQEMEKKKLFRSSQIREPAFPIVGEPSKRKEVRQITSDLTLGLVQRIFLQTNQEPPRVVVFAAVDQGDGCSQIAASVAETLAESYSGAVCLVDANLRSPTLSRMLGTTNHVGLTDSIREQGSVMSFAKKVCNGSFWLLPSGPCAPDSPNLLNSMRMRARMEELRRAFDFVIVDAPPLTRYSDAVALATLSDGMVVVLAAESTRREAARRAVENVRASDIQILGAVMNKRTFPIPDRVYKIL